MSDLKKLIPEARDAMDLFITAAVLLNDCKKPQCEHSEQALLDNLRLQSMSVARAMVAINQTIDPGGYEVAIDRAIEYGSAAG